MSTHRPQGLPWLAMLLACAAPLAKAQVIECAPEQLLLPTVGDDELPTHRTFRIPAANYPGRTEFGFEERLMLALRIDPLGHVVCYLPEGDNPKNRQVDKQRRGVIDTLDSWRYQPFQRDGKPASVVVHEVIPEQALPTRHVDAPDVPLEKVRINFTRTTCFGTCPDYTVDIGGDGRVVYTGRQFVDVTGRHVYRIDPSDVARLVASVREKDLWSMRESYEAHVTDNPTYEITLNFGGKVKDITDYVGEAAGMPLAIAEFEGEVDEISRATKWTRLSLEAVDTLEREGFDFKSAAAARLLATASGNEDGKDDAAMARLVELGAPLALPESREEEWRLGYRRTPEVMASALALRRPLLVEALIAHGALETSGRLDQEKLDLAFLDAISGGSLDLAKRIWNLGGDSMRPSLTFEDTAGDGEKAVKKISSVIVAQGDRDGAMHKDLRPMTEWLVAQGCDLEAVRASGRTLLHVAANARDVDFTRYLLSKGLDPNAEDVDGNVALGDTDDEDVSLLLLNAGTDVSRMETDGFSYRKFVDARHWKRVIAWLDAHGK